MGRALCEIAILAVALIVTAIVISPAISVVYGRSAIGPEEEAYLVLGMVYGFMAPIGYFLSRNWWRRGIAILIAVVSASTISLASYLFETGQPILGAAVLLVLIGFVLMAERFAAWQHKRRQHALDVLEAEVMFEIAKAVQDYAEDCGFSPSSASVLALARQMAQSEAWAAIHEAHSVGDVHLNLDRALAILQEDLHKNKVIESATAAARMVGVIRKRLSHVLGSRGAHSVFV